MTSIKNIWPNYSQEEANKISEILLSNKVNYWTGKECRYFEQEFASYVGTKYAVALSNGSVAIELALNCLNLGKNDEVIVTPRSFIASASSVINVGAKPVFADVDLNSGNISASTIQKVVTKKTKAVICVHINGHPCEMDEIIELCKKNNIIVIEDCAQAHGAKHKDKFLGSMGDFGCYSFCQDKIISTGGEGGMLVTNSQFFWNKVWSMKDHGKNFELANNISSSSSFKWLHDSFGSNYRMTEIQAGIGRIQLKRLDKWNKKREKNVKEIISVLRDFPDLFRIPELKKYHTHAWYRLNVFINEKRIHEGITNENVVEKLKSLGVQCLLGPCPEIYLERAFLSLEQEFKTLPNAQKLGKSSICFLVHPAMSADYIKKTKKSIRSISESLSIK